MKAKDKLRILQELERISEITKNPIILFRPLCDEQDRLVTDRKDVFPKAVVRKEAMTVCKQYGLLPVYIASNDPDLDFQHHEC